MFDEGHFVGIYHLDCFCGICGLFLVGRCEVVFNGVVVVFSVSLLSFWVESECVWDLSCLGASTLECCQRFSASHLVLQGSFIRHLYFTLKSSSFLLNTVNIHSTSFHQTFLFPSNETHSVNPGFWAFIFCVGPWQMWHMSTLGVPWQHWSWATWGWSTVFQPL